MPQPEATLSPPSATAPRSSHATVSGWGGGARAPVTLLRPADLESLREAIRRRVRGGAIARGMGRSYGDAAQLGRGTVLDVRALKGFELDARAGTLTAQAGVTLGELLPELVRLGWILPVVPGTQHVTVGGAIASDIHGKNHGAVGTFGSHVEAIALVRSDGELVECGPGSDDGLFEATIGGMGLTGVIVWARIRLAAVSGATLAVDLDRVENLEEAIAALTAPGGPHRVAWLDLLGSRPARGIVTRAEHLPAQATVPGSADGVVTKARFRIPPRWPAGVLRPSTVRAYNELRFRRAPRRERGRLESFGEHMFPLDVLDAWPRLYGRAGFLQYQLVVPSGAEELLRIVIERLERARVPCYLAVLKDFGRANAFPLSFPIEGWTLALDLPRAAEGLELLLEGYDELVAGAGGRVYLSKDARMRADATEAMYPRLGEWREARERADPERVWRSDLGLRTGLVEAL